MLIYYSKKDVAGRNISSFLNRMNVKTYPVEIDSVFVKSLPKADKIICASKHSSKSGKKFLTFHGTGNFSSDSSVGGNPFELGIIDANIIKNGLIFLSENINELPYEITMEVTHHGPTHFKVPLVYAEVGSTEEEWNDKEACELIAKSIKHVLKANERKEECYIGFGGMHHARKFTKLVLNEKILIGHICPKYNSDNLTPEMIIQMFKKTKPTPSGAIIYKKGLKGKQYSRIKEMLESLNKNYIKV